MRFLVRILIPLVLFVSLFGRRDNLMNMKETGDGTLSLRVNLNHGYTSLAGLSENSRFIDPASVQLRVRILIPEGGEKLFETTLDPQSREFSGTISNIPSGIDRRIQVQTRDASGTILTEADTTTEILPGENRLILHLIPSASNPNVFILGVEESTEHEIPPGEAYYYRIRLPDDGSSYELLAESGEDRGTEVWPDLYLINQDSSEHTPLAREKLSQKGTSFRGIRARVSPKDSQEIIAVVYNNTEDTVPMRVRWHPLYDLTEYPEQIISLSGTETIQAAASTDSRLFLVKEDSGNFSLMGRDYDSAAFTSTDISSSIFTPSASLGTPQVKDLHGSAGRLWFATYAQDLAGQADFHLGITVLNSNMNIIRPYEDLVMFPGGTYDFESIKVDASDQLVAVAIYYEDSDGIGFFELFKANISGGTSFSFTSIAGLIQDPSTGDNLVLQDITVSGTNIFLNMQNYSSGDEFIFRMKGSDTALPTTPIVAINDDFDTLGMFKNSSDSIILSRFNNTGNLNATGIQAMTNLPAPLSYPYEVNGTYIWKASILLGNNKLLSLNHIKAETDSLYSLVGTDSQILGLEDSALYLSPDAGKTWSREINPGSYGHYGLDFTDFELMVGENGTFFLVGTISNSDLIHPTLPQDGLLILTYRMIP